MGKVKNFFVIAAAVLIAASAYPLEEENAVNKKSSSNGSPGLVVDKAQQGQNETDSSESTEPGYIEETYIEVLLPFIPRLNTTEIEAVLNRTANDTDDSDRLKRSPDSEEDSSSLKNVSSPSKESTVPTKLYTSRNINTESAKSDEQDTSSSNESSEDKSKAASSSAAAPPLYQLRNLNTRPARAAGTSSFSSSEESAEGKEKSFSKEDSSEKNTKPYGNSTGTSVLYTSSSSSSRQVREAVDNEENGAARKKDSSDTRIQQPAGNKDNEGTKNKDISDAKTQQSQSTAAPHRPLYSAQNFYSRAARETLRKDDVYLSNGPSNDNSRFESGRRDTKHPVLLSESNSQGQKRVSSINEKAKSPSTGNAAPALYSTGYSNVRKVREVVDSSEDQSSNTSSSTKGPVLYITPQNRALNRTKYIPKEASVSASPETLKATSESR